MDYYELQDDLYRPKKRWFLGSINFDGAWDFWKYVSPGLVEIPNKELFITIRRPGVQIDLTMADFELLIVNEKVKALIDDEEVQFIPVKIEGFDSKHFLMVVNNEIDCINEDKSIFQKWLVNDPIRPDKAGQYKSFEKLVINPDRIPQGNHIFRIKNYHIIIVVNAALKEELEKNKVTGVGYAKLND